MFMISPLYIVTVLQCMIPGIGMTSILIVAIHIGGDVTVVGMRLLLIMILITTMGTEDTGIPVTILNIINCVMVKGAR